MIVFVIELNYLGFNVFLVCVWWWVWGMGGKLRVCVVGGGVN